MSYKKNVADIQGNKLTKEQIQKRLKEETERPVISSDNINPPAYFTEKEKEEFTNLRDELLKVNLITNLDAKLLERYVQMESQYDNITLKLKKRQSIDNTVKLCNLQDKYLKLLRAYGNDLGLSYATRNKWSIKVNEENEEDDPLWDEYLNSGYPEQGIEFKRWKENCK